MKIKKETKGNSGKHTEKLSVNASFNDVLFAIAAAANKKTKEKLLIAKKH